MVILFYAEDGVTPDDPSNTKRFWTPVDSGVALLRTEHNRQKTRYLQNSASPDFTNKRAENPWGTPAQKTI
jgi:hypothetical protein